MTPYSLVTGTGAAAMRFALCELRSREDEPPLDSSNAQKSPTLNLLMVYFVTEKSVFAAPTCATFIRSGAGGDGKNDKCAPPYSRRRGRRRDGGAGCGFSRYLRLRGGSRR